MPLSAHKHGPSLNSNNPSQQKGSQVDISRSWPMRTLVRTSCDPHNGVHRPSAAISLRNVCSLACEQPPYNDEMRNCITHFPCNKYNVYVKIMHALHTGQRWKMDLKVTGGRKPLWGWWKITIICQGVHPILMLHAACFNALRPKDTINKFESNSMKTTLQF